MSLDADSLNVYCFYICKYIDRLCTCAASPYLRVSRIAWCGTTCCTTAMQRRSMPLTQRQASAHL